MQRMARIAGLRVRSVFSARDIPFVKGYRYLPAAIDMRVLEVLSAKRWANLSCVCSVVFAGKRDNVLAWIGSRVECAGFIALLKRAAVARRAVGRGNEVFARFASEASIIAA